MGLAGAAGGASNAIKQILAERALAQQQQIENQRAQQTQARADEQLGLQRGEFEATQATQKAAAQRQQQNDAALTQLEGDPSLPAPARTLIRLNRLGVKGINSVADITPKEAAPVTRRLVSIKGPKGEKIEKALTDAELSQGVEGYVAPKEPSAASRQQEWVVRNGQVTPIPAGTARAGDKPYEKTTGGTGTPDTGPSDYSLERAQRNVEAVDTLSKKVSPWTTGAGSVLSNLPATDARNFAAELNTLKANIAFSELTAMREASKTGGALGQISDREEQLLSSTLGALDPGQSPANFQAQLTKIRDSITRWQQAQAKYGKGPMAATVDPKNLGHVPEQGGVKIHSITEIK